MISIDKLEKKYKFNFSGFEKSLDNYYEFSSSINNPKFDAKKGRKAYQDLTNYFKEIINIAVIEYKIKEPNQYFSSVLSETIIPKTRFYSPKTEFEFTIGLFQDFYVIWEVNFCNNLKSMKDDFWKLLIEFSNLGKFDFKEEKRNLLDLRKKHKHLFNQRGNFYKFMRNYFLTQIEYGGTTELGYIELKWDNEIDKNEMVQKFIHSIEILYKLNILLLKAEIKNRN